MNKILMALNGESKLCKMFDYDFLIAVDGGYRHFSKNNIIPNVIIGDLDSVNEEINLNVKQIKLNPIKDDTDFAAAINFVKENFSDFQLDITGFVSLERPEHFYANLKLLGPQMKFIDIDKTILRLEEGKHEIVSEYQYFSIFADQKVTNLSIKNAKYKLEDFELDYTNPLCISNEALDEIFTIEFEGGTILLFMSE